MRRARFHRILAAILASACGGPHVETSPPPSTSATSVATTAASAAPSASASAVPIATAPGPTTPMAIDVAPPNDPMRDELMMSQLSAFLDPVMNVLPSSPFVARAWSTVAKDALPPGITFIAEMAGHVAVRVLGVAPPDLDARVTERRQQPAPDGGWNVTLAWMQGGVLHVGNTRTLRRALTPIDSPEKAHLLLQYGHRVRFEAPTANGCLGCQGHLVHATANGFELISPTQQSLMLGPCPHSNATVVEKALVIEVDRNGNVTPKRELSGVFPPPQRPSQSAPCIGRDSEGSLRVFAAPQTLGDYFAQLAHDEAISVRSFERLARELAEAGANRLARRATSAARDERRHASMMDALRVRFSGASRPCVEATFMTRALVAWLLENAREGCVRETYCALVAAHQAEHAKDAVVRANYVQIACDEAEHARLAWDVHAWAKETHPELAPLLDDGLSQAFDELIAHAESSAPVDAAGEPPRQVARAIVLGMRAHLTARISASNTRARSRRRLDG